MITVISYNIEYAKETTPESVAAELAPYRPDIVCLCEVPNGAWTAEMAAFLDMPHHVVGTIASANHVDDYPDRTGRFCGKFKAVVSRSPLRTPHERLLDGTGWRPASVVFARTEFNGAAILVGALHVPSGRLDPAHSCARRLSEILAEYDDSRIVIGGDYNDLADSAPLGPLYRAGFRNPWIEVDFDLQNAKTYNAKTDEDGGVIDHLLYRGAWRAMRADILRSRVPQSDHFPILSAFVVPCGSGRSSAGRFGGERPDRFCHGGEA
ncbi:MAG: endonuclease/exonuclease/phosphatase family protein [Kiritimatiellaeota bacterium]|nr:endonuclease/exonuclease/phosphatase family protein [Kiritimatiellota bacterium]